MSSKESAMDGSEADSAVSVSDQVIGLPSIDMSLDIDPSVASTMSSDEGSVDSSECDFAIAEEKHSELFPGSDLGLEIHSCALSSRVSSDEGSVDSPDGVPFFSDDLERIKTWSCADMSVVVVAMAMDVDSNVTSNMHTMMSPSSTPSSQHSFI